MTESARSVPAFAKDFPRHPELDRIVDLFEQGNYAQVRKEARALLQRTADAAPKPPAAKPKRTSAPSASSASSPSSPDASPSPSPSDDAALRAAARELLKRIEPDPLTLYLLAIASGLLVILAGWYWTHPHEPPPARPSSGPVSAP